MKSRNSSLVLALALTAALAPSASARDREFAAAVRHIESTYHVHRSHRFLMWGVGMIIKVAHPEGVRSLRMALFEDQKFSGIGDDAQFTALLEKSLARSAAQSGAREAWQPFARVWSRRDDERTYIYARPSGDDLELFIVALEADEAVVLKVKMNPDKLDEMMEERAAHPTVGRKAALAPGPNAVRPYDTDMGGGRGESEASIR